MSVSCDALGNGRRPRTRNGSKCCAIEGCASEEYFRDFRVDIGKHTGILGAALWRDEPVSIRQAFVTEL